MDAIASIARVLRADKDFVESTAARLAAVTGKQNVLDSIAAENEACMLDRLSTLGLTRQSAAEKVYRGLIEKVQRDDAALCSWLGNPSSKSMEDWTRVLEKTALLAGSPSGFFMKESKAKEFLARIPPQRVLAALGYDSVDSMLAKEDLYEVYSALRFIEGSEWLNTVFFKQYKELTPQDFERRRIATRALSSRWLGADEGFIKKKYHNISHLKELGVVFALPLALDVRGEVMRNVSLVLHYLNEIPFYTGLLEEYAKEPENFAARLISLVSGSTPPKVFPPTQRSRWLVIQRYLAKEDENDARLFLPHLNPEAFHWERAERILAGAGETIRGFPGDLSFWKGMNWVGDYFKTDIGVEVLVSFNIIDTSMSLVQNKEMIKYLYHHQEAMWNKFFSSYFGEAATERYMKDYIVKGWFEI